MHRLRGTVAAALIAGGIASPRSSAESWVALDAPPGGDVRSLAADPRDPRTLYLGTADGLLYRSDDGGQRWRRLAPGFPLRGVSLDEIVVGPRGQVLVAFWELAGSGGGVARSDDGGRTFVLGRGLEGQSVRAVALAPARPERVVAGSLAGVFLSEDGGATWGRISPEGHPDLRNVESVAFDPGDPQTIFAGTWHLAWKTEDGGRGWRRSHAGIIDDSDIFTISFDRRSRRTLYATACSGMYRSLDGGTRWAKLRGIPASSRRTRAFAQDPERPERLFAGTTEGLWASADDAASWRRLTDPLLVINAVLVLPGGQVLVGADGAGVLRSTDGGATWAEANLGFAERRLHRLVFDAAGGRVLAAVAADRAHSGVLAAPRAEGPWSKLGTGLEGREVLSLAPAGRDVLAGTDDGLYLFEAATALWRRLSATVSERDPHPRVPDVAVASGGVWLAATSAGLLRSADGGLTWRHLELGEARSVSAVAASPAVAGLALAATPLGVFRSEDAGATWTAVAVGFDWAHVRSLVFLPGDAQAVLATTANGLLKSVDQGRTWFLRGGGLPLTDIAGVAVHPSGRTIHASDFRAGGLYRSDDAGDSWRRVGSEGLASDRVWTMAVDPGRPERVLAAASSGGLYALGPPAAAAASEPAAAGGR